MATTPTGAPLGDPTQATPAWLTQVLRRSGALERGHVRSVTVESRPTPQAAMARLHVDYSEDADPAAPQVLRLKLAAPHANGRPSAEAAFYRLVALRMPRFPTPRCFDAAQSRDGTRWHVLLEDVSATHDQPPYPVPPTEPQCFDAVACLAELHATWWQHPELMKLASAAGVHVRDEHGLAEMLERTERRVAAFLAFLGDRLSVARRHTFERLLASQESLRRRQLGRPPTLVHGDAHWWNFLYPRARMAGDQRAEVGSEVPAAGVLVIDWAGWTVGPALDDLAHAIALMWFPERRQRLERPLLAHYRRELQRHGVSGYDWQDCWDDYRLFAATRPFTLAYHWERKGWPLVWWNNLERAMLAFEDLDCEELLAG